MIKRSATNYWNLLYFRSLLIAAITFLGLSSTVFAQYCASGATSQFDSNIGEVIFNTINNNTAGICAQYTDFTTLSTNVTIGNNYALSVQAGTCGGNFTKYGKVWIDWNQDGDFLDPLEEVHSFGPAVAPQSFPTTVTVPVTAVIGTTRMRVVVVETGSVAGVLSCGTYTWGETEDYSVVVAPSSPNDIGVSAISAPSSGCNLTAAEQVTIDVTNFGTNLQSAWNVHYSVNGGPVTTEAMSVALPSGGTVPYTFTGTANLGTPGTYNICAWTTLGTDTVPFNDTVCVSVTAIPGVSSFPYVEDFEGGNGGWLPGGTSSTWAFGTPAKNTIIGAASGVNSYVTGGLGTGDYSNNEDSYVLGPCFDFSSLQNPWISMSIWWNSEFSWDGSNLQYSTDFGMSWNNIGNFGDPGNWYNDNSIVGQPGGSQDGWSGRTISNNGSNGWVTAAHRMDGLAGVPSVRLRITFGSDGSVTDDGFAFDDIRISEGPVANLGPDQLLCGGDSIFLNAGNFAAYQWLGGDTTQIDTITQQNTGTIWVKVTDSNGFFDFDTVVVSLSNPQVNIGPDSSICPGDTLFLDAGSHPGGSFAWSNGETTQISGYTTSGTHHVTVTDSAGCTKSDSMVLSIHIPPNLSLGADTTVCANEPVLLNAGSGPVGTVYQWSTGASSQVIVVTSAGTYSASVTTPGGCAAIDTIEVLNHPNPGVNLGPDRTECGTFTLDAGPNGTSYQWSTGATTQSITESTAGTYTVTVTNQFNCSQVDSVTISIGQVPTVALGNDTTLCNGQSHILDAGNPGPGSSWFWSTGATTQTITVSAPGTYIVQVTDPNGCKGSDTLVVNGSSLSVNLGPDVSMCGSDGVYLDAGNPGMIYDWSDGSTTQQIFVNTPGTYTVTVTDPLGCNAVDDIIVGQVPGIAANITAPATANLFQSVQFTDASSPTPTQWDWDFGDGTGSTQQNPSHVYQAFGTFIVTLIVNDGTCWDTTTTTVQVNTFIGIEDEDFAAELDLYPNPSDGLFHLYVELYKPRDLDVEVTDLSGKVLYRKRHGASIFIKDDIDLRHLSRGIYAIKLTAGDRKMVRKLVIH